MANSHIFSIVFVVFVIAFVAIHIWDYYRTKNITTISPEELKRLKKSHLRTIIVLSLLLIYIELIKYIR